MGKLGFMMKHYPHGHKPQPEAKHSLPEPLREGIQNALFAGALLVIIGGSVYLTCNKHNVKDMLAPKDRPAIQQQVPPTG